MNQKIQIPFSAMNLPIEMERAVEQMGFDFFTSLYRKFSGRAED